MNTKYYKLLFTGVIFINPTLSSFRINYPQGLRYFISFGLGAISAVIITLTFIRATPEPETQAVGTISVPERADVEAIVALPKEEEGEEIRNKAKEEGEEIRNKAKEEAKQGLSEETRKKNLQDFQNMINLGFITYHDLNIKECEGDTYEKSDGTIIKGEHADKIAQEMSVMNINLISLCVKKFKDKFKEMNSQDEKTYQELLNPDLTDLRFIEELLKIESELCVKQYKIPEITECDNKIYNNYITNRDDINLELSHKLIKILNNLMEYIVDVYVTRTNHGPTQERKINIIEFLTPGFELIKRL